MEVQDIFIAGGSTSKLIEFALFDASGDLVDLGDLGDPYPTQIDYSYVRQGGITVTSPAIGGGMFPGAWQSGSIARLAAGYYQFGLPNAAIATGAESVLFRFYGATFEDCWIRIHLGIPAAVAAELAASLTVTTPVAATSEGGTVGDPLRLTTWQHTRLQVLLTIEDAQGVDVDLSGHDLSMLIYAKADPDTVIAEWTTGTELTAGLGTLAIDAPATDTADAGDFLFVIRDNGADDTIWAHGSLKIKPAPDTPAAP